VRALGQAVKQRSEALATRPRRRDRISVRTSTLLLTLATGSPKPRGGAQVSAQGRFADGVARKTSDVSPSGPDRPLRGVDRVSGVARGECLPKRAAVWQGKPPRRRVISAYRLPATLLAVCSGGPFR
jgi:hypothetical protein